VSCCECDCVYLKTSLHNDSKELSLEQRHNRCDSAWTHGSSSRHRAPHAPIVEVVHLAGHSADSGPVLLSHAPQHRELAALDVHLMPASTASKRGDQESNEDLTLSRSMRSTLNSSMIDDSRRTAHVYLRYNTNQDGHIRSPRLACESWKKEPGQRSTCRRLMDCSRLSAAASTSINEPMNRAKPRQPWRTSSSFSSGNEVEFPAMLGKNVNST
jgi:hypothetical protein